MMEVTGGLFQGNCGFKDLNRTEFRWCRPEDVLCGMMHCQHYQDQLQIGLPSLASLSTSAMSDGDTVLSCRTALVDLGLSSSDPGLAPAGAQCGHEKMCLRQKCVSTGEELTQY